MKKMISALLTLISLSAFSDTRLISVEGTIEKSFKPNMIIFNVLVWAKGSNAKEAQKAQTIESLRIKNILIAQSILEKDFMSTNYDLNPDYFYDQKIGKNSITGFHANETIQFTLRKTEEAGKIIDAISSNNGKSSGVNINGITWDINNREELQRNLLSDAVLAAKAKAELLANAAHVKIKNVHKITPFNTINYAAPMMNMKSMNAELSGGAPQTSLESGQVKILASVNIDYEID